MKACVFTMMVVLLASCVDHQVMDEVTSVKESEPMEDISKGKAEIESLIDRARWGDGQAYLRLADCYEEGIGVQKDFLGMMCMVTQACTHGAIKNEKEYVSRLTDGNVFKTCFDLMEKSSSELKKGKDSILAQLNTKKCPDALALCGVVEVESGDSIGGFETLQRAANNGSNFAALLMAMPDWKGRAKPDKARLEEIAERIPVVYRKLGEICLNPDRNGCVDEKLAADYFLKAEKHAMLSRLDARWLLSYHRRGGEVRLADEDVRRLETFSRFPSGETCLIVADIVHLDNVMVDNQ